MKASEILELVRAGYTRAEIDAMSADTTNSDEQFTSPPAPAAPTPPPAPAAPTPPPAPAAPTPPSADPTPADAQHMELMKAIQGLTAAVQMNNFMQSGNVGAPSGGMTAEKALAMGTFGGGQNGK